MGIQCDINGDINVNIVGFFWDITPQQGLSRNRVCPKIDRIVIIGNVMIILWSWGNCPVFRQTHTFLYGYSVAMQFTVFQSCCRLQATWPVHNQHLWVACHEQQWWSCVHSNAIECLIYDARMYPRTAPKHFCCLRWGKLGDSTKSLQAVSSSEAQKIAQKIWGWSSSSHIVSIIFPYFPIIFQIFFHDFPMIFPTFFSKGSTLSASAAAAAPSPRCAGTVRCAAGATRRWAATERRRRRRRWWPRWERLRCWGCAWGG